MGVFKNTPLSKIAIAVLINIAVAAPSYAYTLNYQPTYADKQNTQQAGSQTRQQATGNRNQAQQRRAQPAANAATNAGAAAAASTSAAASAAMMMDEEYEDTAAQTQPQSQPSTSAAAAAAMMSEEDFESEAAPANTPSVPSYARAPEPRVAPEPRQQQASVGYEIPRPKFDVNYGSGDVRTNLQGNAFFSVDSSKSESDRQAAAYDKQVISNIRARESDPSLLSLEALKDQRLSSYDKDVWKEDQAKRGANPFGDLFAVEDLYNTIPSGSTAYYVRKDLDDKRFLNLMTHGLDRYIKDYEIGIAILDDYGLVALFNNNDFPIEGIANFELAYMTGIAMNRMGDNLNMHVRYVATDLNRNVYSPFATFALQDVQTKIRKYEDLKQAKAAALARGEEWPVVEEEEEDEETEEGQKKKGPPPIVIAKVVQNAGRGDGFETAYEQKQRKDRYGREERAVYDDPNQNILVSDRIFKRKSDLIAEWKQSEACNKDRFNESLNVYTSTPLKSLLYYALNFNDPNAADLLMAYVGSTTAMNFEMKSKGIKHTQYNIQMSDVKQSPELNYHNAGPLFDMAKMYATYVKDPNVPVAVAAEIDAGMDNTLNVKRGIYRGISNSIRKDSENDIVTLKVRSISGLSGFGSKNLKGVTTELAFIEYRGERYIMAIGIKGVPARSHTEFKSNSEKYVSFIATHMFNLMRDCFPYLKGTAPVVSSNTRYNRY